jgi:hypothetical protein
MTASMDLKVGQLPESLEQLITGHECLLYAYDDWIETLELLHHFRCKAEDKGKIKRSQRQHQVKLILWSQWKRANSLSNSVKPLFLRSYLQYLSSRFHAWKRTEQLRKRDSTIVSQISIEVVMHKVLMSRIVQVWTLRYRLISRSKQLIAKQQARIVNKLLFAWKDQLKGSAVRRKLMLETLKVWKSAKQFRMMQLETKMHCIKTALIDWIRKRRTALSVIAEATKEVKVNTSIALNAKYSMTIQGLKKSNLDYTTWSLVNTISKQNR